MSQADAYMQAQAAANKYQVKGSQLSLLAGRKVVDTFVVATQELADSSWQVTGYNNGREAVVSVLLSTDITAAFDEGGVITGNASCNDYCSGPYHVSDSNIAIGNLATGMMTCDS